MDANTNKNETKPPIVDLLGFPFHRVTEAECVAYILSRLGEGQGGWVVTPNIDILQRMARSPPLCRFLMQANLLVADGMPIVWASRVLGTPLPERVAGSSLVSTLSAGAAREGRSIYLLGGDPGTAELAAQELIRRDPALRVAGTDCPPFGFDKDPGAIDEIAQRVQAASPDIVYVALGCPKQENLIKQIRPSAPRAWFLGVGISFSYLCGDVKRAPSWMRRSGLEWCFRLAQEPGRLARRYLRDDIPFALRLLGLTARTRLVRLFRSEHPAPRLAPRAHP